MKLIKLNKKSFNIVLKEAERAVREGKVVICPTDTVYGLCANALNQKAVNKVFKIKKRSKKKPLSVFAKSIGEASKISFLGKAEAEKMKSGKVTGILKAKRKFPKGVLAKGGTIGVRIPDHVFIKKLLKMVKTPLTGTSANVSGKPASMNIKEILLQFEKEKYKPDLVIDSGNLKKRKPSTVVDFTREGRTIRK
jgi:L-threonylcarbamoyladenylate synthase